MIKRDRDYDKDKDKLRSNRDKDKNYYERERKHRSRSKDIDKNRFLDKKTSRESNKHSNVDKESVDRKSDVIIVCDENTNKQNVEDEVLTENNKDLNQDN